VVLIYAQGQLYLLPLNSLVPVNSTNYVVLPHWEYRHGSSLLIIGL